MRSSITREVSLFFVLLSAAIVIFLFDRVGLLSPLKSGFAYISDPVEVGLYTVRKSLEDQVGFISKIRDVARENRELSQKLATAQAEVERLKGVELENTALRNQFNAGVLADRKLMPAKIVGLNRYLVINQGERLGVRSGQTVVFGNNFVGKVIATTPNIAKVRLPTDPDSKITGLIYSASQTKGIVVGSFGSGMSFDKVSQDEKVEEGQAILTEGDEGLYPKGLVVGQIEKVSQKDAQLFQEIELSPPVSYEDLDTVFVIVE